MFEAFGELVIQGVLLSRFKWLITKQDFSSFGLSFQIYVVCVMSISFVTMIAALLTYHNRDRKHIRKTFSLHTASLALFWTLLLVAKVSVYVFGFLNNPGLFWVPMLVKICFLWLLFSCCSCESFVPYKALPAHDKFVFLLANSLVPVSCPSKDTNGMKGLYAVSITLFSLECLFVLIFAYLIRHFYHFEAYREFYCEVLPKKFSMEYHEIFNALVVTVFSAIISVTVLLSISYKCWHPKRVLFQSKKASGHNDT